MAAREATSLKGVTGLDGVAADSAGAGIRIEDLAEREFEGRNGINTADTAVDDADADLRARIGGYQRYLDHHAKQPACEEIVTNVRGWTDQATMETKSEELYVQHLDLVKSYDDKIAEAQHEMRQVRGGDPRLFRPRSGEGSHRGTPQRRCPTGSGNGRASRS